MENIDITKKRVFKPKHSIGFFILLIFLPIIIFGATIYYELQIIAFISLAISIISLFIWLKFILYYIVIDADSISKKNIFFNTKIDIKWKELKEIKDITETFKLGEADKKIRKLVIYGKEGCIEIADKSLNKYDEFYKILENISEIKIIDNTK